jgi:pantothenate synthetase
MVCNDAVSDMEHSVHILEVEIVRNKEQLNGVVEASKLILDELSL